VIGDSLKMLLLVDLKSIPVKHKTVLDKKFAKDKEGKMIAQEHALLMSDLRI
jgi:hypothetical protein